MNSIPYYSWRVFMYGPSGEPGLTEYSSRDKAHDFAKEVLNCGLAHTAQILHQDGDDRWSHYETMYSHAISLAPVLTVADVIRSLTKIAAATTEPTAARDMADRLYREVLSAIVAGHPDSQSLAKLALYVDDILVSSER